MNATLTPQGMFMAMTCTASDDEICWNLSGEVPLPKSGDSRDGWEVHQKTEVERTKSELRELLEDASGEWGSTMKEIVEKTSTVKFYPIYRLPLGGAWFKGRCLLLGDAAHAMQPHAGQVRETLPLFSHLFGNGTLRESSSGARFLHSHRKPHTNLSNRAFPWRWRIPSCSHVYWKIQTAL
jgi:hypothetical protein